MHGASERDDNSCVKVRSKALARRAYFVSTGRQVGQAESSVLPGHQRAALVCRSFPDSNFSIGNDGARRVGHAYFQRPADSGRLGVCII